MKKLFLFFSLIIAAGCGFSQAYMPPATIPPYHILTTDSVYVTPANLKKGKPVMIIYFSPDCSHCQRMMYEMKPSMLELKNVQIIMITFVQQLKAIQVFNRDFALMRYPNVVVGTEGYTYTVQKFYKVKTTPYIALYDRKGKLSRVFDSSPVVADVVKAAMKL